MDSVVSARCPRSKKKRLSSIDDPQIIGYYSTDGEQNYLANSSRMSYFKVPKSTKIRMDLNQGIESAVRFRQASVGHGSMSHSLEWIVRNHTRIRRFGSNGWIEPDFVTSGGVLTRLLYTPYFSKGDWEIRAAKWKGTIYLCRIATQSEENVDRMVPWQYSSWGYKFEQYIVSDHPDKDPDTSRPVVEAAQFRCVFKRRFGRHSVLFTSEVDAVQSPIVLRDPLPLKDLKLIELKTKKPPLHAGQQRRFREEVLLKWWAQSFLTGTDNILCGWRDDKGIVRSWTTYSLDQMIELGQGTWDPQTCIDHCNDFLDSCAELVVDECDKTVYKFEKIPNNDIRVTRLPSSHGFIPTEVLSKMGACGAA